MIGGKLMPLALAVAAALLANATAANAVDAAALAKAFGAREEFYGAALSPDGKHVTYLNPAEDRTNTLVLVDLSDGTLNPILLTGNVQRSIEACIWIKNDRMLCQVGRIGKSAGFVTSTSYLIGLAANGGDIKFYGYYAYLGKLPDDPDNILFASSGSVYKFNVRTGRSQTDDSIGGASMVATDSAGVARLKWLRDYRETANEDWSLRPHVKFWYRAKRGAEWLRLGTADLAQNLTFDALGFDESGRWLYIEKPKDGRLALFRFAADGSNQEELVFARPDVDIGGLVRIGKFDRPIGVTYTDEFEHTFYFDRTLEGLAGRLQKALPGQPPVSIIDETWDGAKLLLFAGSDVDPGAYYIYDKASKRLGKLSDIRPALADIKLSERKPVRYTAADGTIIPGYLTLPVGRDPRNLPTIVMPHGGPAARDTRGFDWLSQYFAQLGYAVLQPNFRGSSGYGEEWFNTNGFRKWRTAISDINDGTRWLVSQGIADQKRLAIFGWSYGGYAALQANVVDPNLYRATIAVAPVTDLDRLRAEGAQYSNHNIQADYIGTGPEASAGSPAQHAKAFNSPVLMFHGSLDLNVNVAQSNAMKAALDKAGKRNELVIYPNLEHSLIDSKVRADMLEKSAAFLAANLKP